MEGIYLATVCVIFIQFFVGFIFYIATMFLEKSSASQEQKEGIERAISRFQSATSVDEMEKIFKYFSVVYQVVFLAAFAIIMAIDRYSFAMDIFGYIFLILAAIQVIFSVVIVIKKLGFNKYYTPQGDKNYQITKLINLYYIRHFVGIGLSPVLLFQRI